MSELIALWMPILASAVGIFFASFFSWVIIGHHNADWAVLPNEAENVRKLGELNLPAGRYVFPCAREGGHGKRDQEGPGCQWPVGHD